MPATEDAQHGPREGWGVPRSLTSFILGGVPHYFRDGRSLCGRYVLDADHITERALVSEVPASACRGCLAATGERGGAARVS